MRQREAGFTLLEMLVALVVFGLVMAGLTQTFRYGLSAWSAANRRAPAAENLAAMDAALARMIAQAQPGSVTGKPGGLAFTTRLPAGAGLKTGLADAAILLAPDGTLILRYGAHPPGVPLVHPPAPRTEPLATGVTAVKFSYLAPRDGGPPAWSDMWEDGGLPLLVRVHLQLASGQTWPDLVAAPVAAGN
jgi:general secretion pathway protein J